MERVTVELMNTTETILHEINHKKSTKKDIAKTYALAIKSSDKTDWKKVNLAIIDRWSISALEDIKKWAWSGECFKDNSRGGNNGGCSGK